MVFLSIPQFPKIKAVGSISPVKFYFKKDVKDLEKIDSQEEESFTSPNYDRIKKLSQEINILEKECLLLGEQNKTLKKKIKRKLQIENLENWENEYEGPILDIHISVNFDCDYDLANDFIFFHTQKAIKEYFIFYFKYFLIALWKIKSLPNLFQKNQINSSENDKNTKTKLNELEIFVSKSENKLFSNETINKAGFVPSALLEQIWGLIEFLEEKENLIFKEKKSQVLILKKQILENRVKRVNGFSFKRVFYSREEVFKIIYGDSKFNINTKLEQKEVEGIFKFRFLYLF